jgi:hypothetical protein
VSVGVGVGAARVRGAKAVSAAATNRPSSERLLGAESRVTESCGDDGIVRTEGVIRWLAEVENDPRPI